MLDIHRPILVERIASLITVQGFRALKPQEFVAGESLQRELRLLNTLFIQSAVHCNSVHLMRSYALSGVHPRTTSHVYTTLH